MAEDGGEVLDSWEELDDKDVSLSIQTYRITVKEKHYIFQYNDLFGSIIWVRKVFLMKFSTLQFLLSFSFLFHSLPDTNSLSNVVNKACH